MAVELADGLLGSGACVLYVRGMGLGDGCERSDAGARCCFCDEAEVDPVFHGIHSRVKLLAASSAIHAAAALTAAELTDNPAAV